MIELFAIFSKGGLMLWCINESKEFFKDAVNDLIGNVILQQRNLPVFKTDSMSLKYKLDNEFDLVFLVVYQSVIQLSYADKLLTEVNLRFRDMYKNVLGTEAVFLDGPRLFKAFSSEFPKIVGRLRDESLNAEPKKPRSYDQSEKSKRTVASLIQKPTDEKAKKEATKAVAAKSKAPEANGSASDVASSPDPTPHTSPRAQRATSDEDEEVARNREAMFNRMNKKEPAKKPKAPVGKKKAARVWELSGNKNDLAALDYSAPSTKTAENGNNDEMAMDRESETLYSQNAKLVGKFKGDLPGLDEGDHADEMEDEDEENDESETVVKAKSGWLSAFTSLVSNKQLTEADVAPALEQMKINLIRKNVAAEPAEKICESVGAKLVGRVVGTFSRVTTIVRDAMRESLMQLLTPKRRVDILRDVLHAKSEGRPYVIVFCGVNGVGKSTNLAKITFWLNENGHRVLIAAGDTFRAGAVEQLRTHTRCLNSLHKEHVQLYEQGYGCDSSKLARSAIQIAKERGIDVVLLDTAGRMQDNGPLMQALSSLIHTNNPDLVLFVGEALVGNEAVDQLVKFNQALADHSAVQSNPRLIDGIVLTKFDTIDDKVGAAVSMTYITGQPIVFVGTGQTYNDLKSLNANAVVNILLK
ncbi:Signal recognition particle receptor subunit alpha-like protein [Aphelenchoides besseyi]|nr:Signal recognition particle receptor subunit alpha-like protein [Aphelenchoides besseyi]